ncbi:helix-turn-helix transcriptional regulator [Streptomyces sp. NA04227]|uniref:helix-turn-helix domain-containing protein n=1 Tax=Streptomyces sp. NA04227 TaxID=2742136 RepID=UPI0015919E6F|nr:helix-turn-helix transcriptional regulator [Streptomyces sp. NA04227]QKW09352.1 helix-turn-helix transcriptional regulator [Streptomyces sp. NA04227]
MHKANRPKKGTSWHVIGAQLGHFRRAANLTQRALADLIHVDEETIASIEQGRRPLKLSLAEILDNLLETKGVLAVAVEKVPLREKVPAFVQDFLDYEQEALTVLSYQNQVVPGLLQTKEYAAAAFDCYFPPVAEEIADNWLSARMARRQVWQRERPPVANFVIEEAVLQRPLGGEEAMQRQIAELRRFADLPNVGVQIMLTNTTPHAGLAGPMVLLETPDHDDLAYVEGQLVSFLHEDPGQVSVLQQKYGMLRSQALSPRASMDLLDELLGES